MAETPADDVQETQITARIQGSDDQSVQESVDKLLRFTDIAAAVILSIATVTTAWCAYQSTRWGGVQATAFAEASTSRIESTREYNRAFQLLSIDGQTFLEWVDAYADQDTERLEFYQSNIMRPEFLPFLEEWVATQPRLNPDADRNPLMNEAYQRELMAESGRLRDEAEVKFQEATEASQTGDEYILATVLFASVLFFAGISNKFERVRIQAVLVGIAFLMFLIGVIQFGTLPIK